MDQCFIAIRILCRCVSDHVTQKIWAFSSVIDKKLQCRIFPWKLEYSVPNLKSTIKTLEKGIKYAQSPQ